MATCNKRARCDRLELPAEFEDLTGLLQTDLRAIVAVLTQRAGERLLLTRRETQPAPPDPLEQPDRRPSTRRSSRSRPSAAERPTGHPGPSTPRSPRPGDRPSPHPSDESGPIRDRPRWRGSSSA